MIDKILALGLTALGATMMTKKGGLFIESSTYSDFEITDRIVDSIRVFESGSNVYEKAYNLAGEYLDSAKRFKRYTIGNGMTYVFKKGGIPHITNYPSKGLNAVRATDTLTGLKNEMGYSGLSSSEFAKKLTENFAKAASYSRVAKDLDRLGIPFRVNYAEALMEMSYGSGSSYFIYRYSYYKSLTSAWGINKNGWMPRIFFAAMVAKGENVDATSIKGKYYHTNSKYLENKSLLIRDIQREFGYNASW